MPGERTAITRFHIKADCHEKFRQGLAVTSYPSRISGAGGPSVEIEVPTDQVEFLPNPNKSDRMLAKWYKKSNQK